MVAFARDYATKNAADYAALRAAADRGEITPASGP
jgi:hypothetical protein